ncbi:MAG: hypothetical protein JWM36_226 [Hyphomicrobiales bacterium]|nr:hypothetical protein [Hyphomicrobiales bacterium]
MRKLIFAGATALMAFGGLAVSSGAQAAPLSIDPMSDAVQSLNLTQDAQYFYGGRRYCFYPNGWRGPGFYWCGYAWRRGYGWGGGQGWRGWGGGGGGRVYEQRRPRQYEYQQRPQRQFEQRQFQQRGEQRQYQQRGEQRQYQQRGEQRGGGAPMMRQQQQRGAAPTGGGGGEFGNGARGDGGMRGGEQTQGITH